MIYQNINIKIKKDKYIFKNQKLEIKENSINILKGKNGCGKSVLLGYISGLYQYKDVVDVMYLPSISFLDNNLNVLDNILYIAKLLEIETQYEEVLDISKKLDFEMYLNSFIVELSEGTKQKICLSLIFMDKIKKKYILIDEPLNFLDTESQEKVLKRLEYLTNAHTFVIAEHREINLSCSNNIFISEGKIINET